MLVICVCCWLFYDGYCDLFGCLLFLLGDFAGLYVRCTCLVLVWLTYGCYRFGLDWLFSVLLVLRVICFLDLGDGLLFGDWFVVWVLRRQFTLICGFCGDCDVCAGFVG